MAFPESSESDFKPADNFFLRLPLGQKLSLLSAILIIGIAVFIAFFLPARRASVASEVFTLRVQSVAQLCSRAIEQSQLPVDIRSITKLIEPFESVPDLEYIVLVSDNNKVVYSVNHTHAINADYQTCIQIIDLDKLVAKTKAPVVFPNRKTGIVYVGLSLKQMQQEINETRLIAIAIAAVILLLGALFLWFIYRFISTPLDNFLQTVKAISAGDYRKRVPIVSADEIGTLSSSFNNMLDVLEHANTDLLDLNKTLEEKVKERTSFLESEVVKHRNTTVILRKAQSEIEKYREVFTEGPIVIIRMHYNNDLLLEYTSENISQFGYFAWEILQEKRTLLSLAAPDEVERIRAIFEEQLYNTTSHFEFSFNLIKSNGNRRHVYCYFAIHRTNYGKAVFFSGYMLDITGVKKTEEDLLEAQSQFKIVFEKNGLGIVLSDISGKIFEANEAFQRFIGYTLDELKTKSLQDISLREDLSRDMFAFRKGIIETDDSVPVCFEKRYVHRSGAIVWGRITATFVRNMKNEVQFGLSMIEDITQEKATSLLIHRQNSALNSAAKALTILLKNTELESAMNQVLEVLGKGTKASRAFIAVNTPDSSGSDEYTSLIFEWCADGIESQLNNDMWSELNTLELFTEWFANLKNDKIINTYINNLDIKEKNLLQELGARSIFLVPLFVHNVFWGVLGFSIHHDDRIWSEQEEAILKMAAVSLGSYIERYQAEEELVLAKEKAMESDKMKSTLLTNMSHEFRTPMNGILGYSDILADEVENPNLRKMAKGIGFSGARLLSTLDCILDLSQLESNKIAANCQNIPLATLIKPFIKNFSAALEEKNLSLSFVIENYNVSVFADPTLVEKVFRHLFENAIKFTKAGGITVTIDVLAEGHKAWGCVHIKDTGIGIASEHHQFIFDEFRQVSEGHGRGFEGSGLGLAVASRMIKLMNGEIRLESALGSGSKFSILIPAVNSSRSDMHF